MKSLEKWTMACVVLATATCGGMALAATETVDGIEWTYTIADGVASIGTGNSRTGAVASSVSGEIAIPEMLGGAPVTRIADYAFSGRSGIAGITIPDSVTSIGQYAFRYCYGLTVVEIPENVENIGYEAFGACTNLSKMTLPFIGSGRGGTGNGSNFGYIFGQATTNGANVVTQRYSSSYSATYYIPSSLKEVTITDETLMGYGAFQNCSMLTNVTLNAGVANVSDYGFASCSGLTEIPKGGAYRNIGYNGFSYCSGLRELAIPAGVETIEDYAFRSCRAATNLALPTSMKTIGQYAFQYCSGLTEAEIPKNVASIGYEAFGACTNLSKMTLPFIGSGRGGTGNGSNFGYIFGQVTTNGANVVTQRYNSSYSATYYIPSSLKEATITDETLMGYGAFQNCSMLTNVTLNAGVTNVSDYGFAYCSGLTEIPKGGEFQSIGYNGFSYCSGLRELAIPAGVETIEDYAFRSCRAATNLALPASVKTIGQYAFRYCYGLTAVEIPENVESIGYEAFGACTNLSKMTLPFIGSGRGGTGNGSNFGYIFGQATTNGANVVTQRYNSSYSATYYIPSSLKEVTITDETLMGYGAFQNCSMLTNVTLNTGVTNVSDYGFASCSGLTEIPKGGGYRSVGYNGFSYCSGLRELAIPAGVETIEDYAFRNCRAATNLALPASVNKIGQYAFRYCYGLTEAEIPENVASIGYEAFGACTNLSKMTLPFIGSGRGGTGNGSNFGYIFGQATTNGANVVTQRYSSSSWATYYIPSSLKEVTITDETLMGYGAFQNCSMLTNVTLNAGVTNVSDYGFASCSGLTEIPKGGEYRGIGYNGFSYCSGLRELAMPDGVETIGDYAFRSCRAATNLALPASLKTIGQYAFRYCSGLTAVEIPENVASIGYEAFGACTNLSKMTLPFIGSGRGGTGNGSNFGYIFGQATTNGADVVTQNYNASYSSTYYIPSSLKEVTITDETLMGYGAFQNCSMLTDVVLNEGMSNISDYGFAGCSGLKEMVVPASVGSIGDYAFKNCTGLEKVELLGTDIAISTTAFSGCPASLFDTGTVAGAKLLDGVVVGYTSSAVVVDLTETRGMAEGAFRGNTNVTSVTLPAGMATVPYNAFNGCTRLTNVAFAAGTTKSIGPYAFNGCTSLATLSLPEGLESIGAYAFNGCTGLKNLVLPEGTVSVGAYAFQNCTALANVTVPGSLESIGDYAFYGDTKLGHVNVTNLAAWCGIAFGNTTANPVYYAHGLTMNTMVPTEMTIPDGVERILPYAFNNATLLTGMKLPDTVKAVGSYAFQGCTALTNVLMPEGMTAIDSHAFQNCSSLDGQTLPNTITNIGSWAFAGCSEWRDVVLPDALVSIGDSAFSGCSQLRSVEIPASLVSVGTNAFQYATKLQTVSISDLAAWCGITFGTVEANPAYYAHALTLNGKVIDKLEIPSGVTRLPAWGFCDNTALTSVRVPEGVTDIPRSAFNRCYGITNVVLPNGVTNIGMYAFQSCSNLPGIELPASLKTIDQYAFNGCSGFTRIVIPDGVTRIGDYAFQNCSNLEEIVIPGTVTSIGQNAFAGCSLRVVIAVGTVAIPSYLFAYCGGIQEVSIPDTVTFIGSCAFQNCSGLHELVLPPGLGQIDAYAFYGCSGLEQIALPAQVANVGTYAFANCSALEQVTFEEGVTNIASFAFYNCPALASPVWPSTLRTIGDYAYWGCMNLHQAAFPPQLAAVGNYAFTSCSNLASVAMPVRDETWSGAMWIGQQAFASCPGLQTVSSTDLRDWCRIDFGDNFANPVRFAGALVLNGESVTELVIPDGIAQIKPYAFIGCSNLLSATLAEGITNVALSAFNRCTGLESVTIPEGVVTLGQWSFWGCSNLVSLVVPESVRNIGQEAFQNNVSLSKVAIPATVAGFATNAFSGCIAVEEASIPGSLHTMATLFPSAYKTLATATVSEGSPSIRANLFAGCLSLAEVTIPGSVTNIGAQAFLDCASLGQVAISGGVGAIGEDAFLGCKSLQSIDVAGENTVYKDMDGVLYTADGSTLLRYPGGKGGTCAVEEGTATIAKHAFRQSVAVKRVEIPASVTSIGENAFLECDSLEAIKVAADNAVYRDLAGVLYTKDGSTLLRCPGGYKGNFTVAEGVLAIADGAFSGCAVLTGVTVPGSVATIGAYAFDGCAGLTVVELNRGLLSIGGYAFRNCSSLTSLTIPGTVETLGRQPFDGCSSLVNLIIPEGLVAWTEEINGTISGNRVLSRGTIYLVTGNLTVANGGTLTIPSGVVVKFNPNVSLSVNSGGSLEVQGTRANPVVFTSSRDDSIGGDTNGDGGATVAAPGDWLYVWVYGKANFDYAHVFYGGGLESGNTWGERGPLMTGNSGILNIDHSLVAHSAYDGIWNWGGQIRVSNTVVTDVGLAACPYRGSTNEYVNCVFHACGDILMYWSHWAGKPKFSNCVFSDMEVDWCNNGEVSSAGVIPDGVTMKNCVFWDGKGTLSVPAQVGSNGNVWGNPAFMDAANGDFRIQAGSVCIDAGDGEAAPELDYWGQPRLDVVEVADTGTAAANGAVPDIGIHEYLPGIVASDVDLAVTGVEAPEKLTVGETVTVTWRVKNAGVGAAVGPWTDVVELVGANGAVATLGRVKATGELVAGGERVFNGEFTVPASAMGRGYVRVTANGDRDLFEGTLTANNVGKSDAVDVDLPELGVVEGDAVSLTIGPGAATAFRVPDDVVSGGGVLLVRTSGDVAVRTGNGMVPTEDIYHAAGVPIAENTWAVSLPEGNAALYAMVANGGAVSARVEVSVERGALLLFETGTLTVPNEGTASLSLFGNGFANDMDVWIEKTGTKKSASEVVVSDSVRAAASFAVSGLPEGVWTVHVKRGANEASAALLILTQKKFGPKWNCKLDMASAVRSGREYVGYVEYGNAGDVAMDAPYVKLTAGRETLIRFGTADAWGETLELMAVSGTYPASQLKPGETRRIPFRYKTTGSSLSVDCSYTLEDGDAFPWAAMLPLMRPGWADDALWGLASATLRANVGETWDAYLARMRANCDHLAKIGQSTHRLDRIWQLEINEALGVDHAVSTLAANTDLARSGRGFGLALARSYGSGLHSRLRKGIFGYGWSDNYSAYAELQNGGSTLALHSGSGSSYLFEKVNGKWTPEDARDKTTLTETSAEYVLRYRSGTVQRISKDNMRVTSVKDNQGNELTFTYDGDKLAKVQHCDGQSLSFAYANGLLVSATDDQGRTTRYEYSGDLLVKATAFNGMETRYRYLAADGSATGRALRQIAYADGTTRDYTYDAQGRVATVAVNGNLQMVEIVRGALGSYTVIAPNGGQTAVTLGASGEVLETVNALGQKSVRTYTEDTLLESVIGPTGKRAKIAYDEDGQAVKATDAAGAETEFGYTADFGNLAKVTDARGNSFDYGYDNLGRSLSISYADGSIESIAYNPRGDVTNSVNRRGQSIAFTYDKEGNTLSKVWEDGRTFTWAYDAKGNCTNATDSVTGTVTMEYDENERLVRIVHPKGRGFEYEYDALGRTVARTMLGGTGSIPSAVDIQRYEYDALGRLSRMTDGNGNLWVENAYDDTTGWLITQTYGNGTVVSNTYDILGRTVRITHFAKDGTVMDFFAYEYDAEGQRVSQTTKEGVERYAYDTVGQLTDVVYPDGTEEHFRYDAVGNRIEAKGAAYVANNLNQYTAVGDTTFAYDSDGNLTKKMASDGTTYYYYDIQNRLVGVTNETADIRWSCEYDVFGNRSKVINHDMTKEVLFVQESLPSVAAEFNVSSDLSTRYILLGSARLAHISGGEPSSVSSIRYYHADGSSSTRILTDVNGAPSAIASYNAFGSRRTMGESQNLASAHSAGWIGILGVECDDATGLIFMRNRYYDTEQGRFLQMDSTKLAGGDANLYRYCFNDSMGFLDILGRNPVKWGMSFLKLTRYGIETAKISRKVHRIVEIQKLASQSNKGRTFVKTSKTVASCKKVETTKETAEEMSMAQKIAKLEAEKVSLAKELGISTAELEALLESGASGAEIFGMMMQRPTHFGVLFWETSIECPEWVELVNPVSLRF